MRPVAALIFHLAAVEVDKPIVAGRRDRRGAGRRSVAKLLTKDEARSSLVTSSSLAPTGGELCPQPSRFEPAHRCEGFFSLSGCGGLA
jgi:hypothetical protein